MKRPIISYNVNESGELNIFYNERVLCSVGQCEGITDNQIENLIEEILNDNGYVWNKDGTIDKII